MTDRRLEQGRSFGAAAGAYERGRPPYPTEAINWLLPGGARRVLDIGAGTGKLTRLLVERGLQVVAVEPLAEMRAELARAVPGVSVLEGCAEEIPVGDASFDVVVAAQAWHWVDPARAVPEAARVLVPGGRLGLIWNTRDERVGWLAELGRIMAMGAADDADFDNAWAEVGAPFGPVETKRVEWTHAIRREAVLDLVASRSYVIVAPEPARAMMLEGVRRLIDTHPDMVGRDVVEVPYVTRAFRTSLESA